MLCNKCSDKPRTVGDVLACRTCKNDGTANEIPKHLPVQADLEVALTFKPGLDARFTPEKVKPEEQPAPIEPDERAEKKMLASQPDQTRKPRPKKQD